MPLLDEYHIFQERRSTPGTPRSVSTARGSYSRELCFSHIRYLVFELEGCGCIYLAAAGTAAETAALPGRLWTYSNV